ncbi:MAG TPA: HAMP domain-containing sensor histidine kinase [Methylomirabilota bacterium]|jgi:signal transduction histidine kinase
MVDPRMEAAADIARAQAALDQALAELDKLPATDAKSIGLAAHALNNFLMVSGAVVSLLQRTLRDHPNPQVKVWLEGLGHATNLMIHTVSRLISNSTGGELTLKLNDIELPRLVEKACAYYQQAAAQKGLQLTFTASGDIPTIRTDGVVVAAVLDNLLSNAVKYSPSGKGILVRVQGERNGVVCSVQDEGPGLNSQDQARLFHPGTRLGPVPSAGEPSTGYGLALAKQFVETLGGEISCTSAPGKGATFSFWLPPRVPQKAA